MSRRTGRREFVKFACAGLAAAHTQALVSSVTATAKRGSGARRHRDGIHDASEVASTLVADTVDWAEFLGRHDLLWDATPTKWGDSPFLGNGRLAVSIRSDPADDNCLRFSIDHADVYDRRDNSWGWTAYSQSRYHVGDLLLKTVGTITGFRMRLVLHDGELTGTITTSAGKIELVAFVHALRMVVVVRLNPSGGEQNAIWHWSAGEAVSSRRPVRNAYDQAVYQQTYGHPAKIWVDNPSPDLSEEGDAHQCVQKLLAGGAYSTSWREFSESDGYRVLFASCLMSCPGTQAIADSVSELRMAAAAGFDSLREANRAWWHSYYPASFLSVPDAQFESFYWIQMYKYGCAAPKQTGVIDTHGPWLQPTNWPYITWNLNTQISYWALQPSNRLALADGLFTALDEHLPRLRRNADMPLPDKQVTFLGHCSQQDLRAPMSADVRFEREWGNLLWICHNYWLQYRFTMDRSLLENRLYPLLRLAVSFYLPHLKRGADSKLHLPSTFSPEIGSTRDCCYDLALLKWACATLISASEVLAHPDRLRSRWQQVTNDLTSYPVDEHGLRIGSDLAASPHRHFSHLLMIYPLYLLNWDDAASRPLIQRSINFWYEGARRAKSDAGFTSAVGSSFYASMQDGDGALACLNDLLNSPTGMGKLMSNTMYAESGQNIETPLAAAQAYHDMVLQSWGDRLRIFPAVPSRWKDLVFHNLRAQGAFLVSARMEDGTVTWIRVKSLHGERCTIECKFPGPPRGFSSSGELQVRTVGPDLYELKLMRRQEALLSATESRPLATVSPLTLNRWNYYGYHGR